MKMFCCSHCNKKYKTKNGLRLHLNVHSENPKQYPCSSCSKVFLDPTALRSHSVTHIQTKEFGCAVCSKEFKTKKALETHTKTKSHLKKLQKLRSKIPAATESNNHPDSDRTMVDTTPQQVDTLLADTDSKSKAKTIHQGSIVLDPSGPVESELVRKLEARGAIVICNDLYRRAHFHYDLTNLKDLRNLRRQARKFRVTHLVTSYPYNKNVCKKIPKICRLAPISCFKYLSSFNQTKTGSRMKLRKLYLDRTSYQNYSTNFSHNESWFIKGI